MIRIKDLVKTFEGARGEVRALRGVSFEVSKGQLFTLARPKRLRQDYHLALYCRVGATAGRRHLGQ